MPLPFLMPPARLPPFPFPPSLVFSEANFFRPHVQTIAYQPKKPKAAGRSAAGKAGKRDSIGCVIENG